jgi:serine/threonine protein kinase
METLINEGGYGCIYYPKIDCSGNLHPESKMVSKLIQYDHGKDEIYISNLIRKIPNYKNHFLVVEDNCTIDKAVPFKKCDSVKQDTKFKILYIPYKQQTPSNRSFHSLYKELLESIQLLVHNKIVHFDIKPSNTIQAENVYLIDFGISIDMTHVYSNVTHYFYKYHIQYYHWPLEVHLLCYRLHVGKITLDILEKICRDFVKHHIVLQKSNDKFVKEYTEKSIEYYSDIITFPTEEFIKKCISSWKTWDNYALIICLFQMNYTIPTLFFKNIHYLPSERLSISKCLELTATSLRSTSRRRTPSLGFATSTTSYG